MATATKTQIQPLHNLLLVAVDPDDEKTRGGIVLPKNRQPEAMQRGTVVAVGPGKRTAAGDQLPMSVSVGDRILFKEWSGTEVMHDDRIMKLLCEDDVFGTLGSVEEIDLEGVDVEEED